MSEVKFTVNGKEYKVSNSIPSDTSLNSFLRNNANLRGTKAMCHEGGCGACIVTASTIHPVTKKPEILSVNSCLVSVLSCHGWAIKTIEGIGNKGIGYHPIQNRLAGFNGTQCGYCSPGWVMNMYSMQESKKDGFTMKEVENSFAGNICRCTGYRPILDAFKSFSKDADPHLLQQVIDIEEVSNIKMCAKSGLICTQTCGDHDKESGCTIKMDRPIEEMIQSTELLSLDGHDTKWYKVYTLKDIFEIFKKEGTDSYMLVAGNTAQGVYHMKELPRVMIDITSVPDLRKYEKGASLCLGGNMTLNEIMDVFQEIAASDSDFSYLHQMHHHMDLIAHVPVRNIGTLAGNLSIKHEHKEFQSDMFVLLEAIGASITILEKENKQSEVSPTEYLKMDMKGRIISKVNLPPLSSDYVFKSYKIMPRAQNAHAHINAGFLFKFNSDKSVIEQVRIVYGAINPNFIHATATEKFLIGKNIFSKTVLKSAIETLNNELNPDFAPPEPSPEYRKKLAVGLFYKCILNICPANVINIHYKSGGDEFNRPVSSGKQDYETKKEVWPLNKPIPKIEALVQCSGEGVFMNDIPTLPNEVYAAFVLSTVYDGQIDKIDGSPALADKGVIAVYTYKDIPGSNNFTGNSPMLPDPEEILCSGKILFNGQPVAIVVAKTERLAKLAAEKVKVTYKNTGANPALLTIRDVMKSPFAKDRTVKNKTEEPTSKGEDVKKVIKGSFDMFGQYHYTMETQTCVCIPIEDGMDVYSATQWMDLTNIAIAQALNVPVNSINVHVRRLGGGYGGKISRSIQIATACAVAAKLLNRPVRFVMPLEANMMAIGKRLPCSCDYEVGVNDDGVIQYMKTSYYEDDGWSHNEGVAPHAMESFFNCYDKSRWFVEANSVITDTASNTWCRAPGTTEGVAMIENIMQHIAIETKKDPMEVRMKNFRKENNPLPDLIKQIKDSSNYEQRAAEVKQYNSANRWHKRGISLVPLRYGVGYWGNFASLVSIYYGDGSVSITHGGIEMGQGLNTKVAQVCAHTLGIPLEMVTVKPSNNLTAPNAMVTGGSIGSEVCAYATIKACEILLERLKPYRDDKLTWQQMVTKAHWSNVDLCAHHMFTVLDGLQPYEVWGATAIEVEVDMITGNHQVLRVDILEDTGESLSPQVDIGQVEGAYVMGLGYWTSEHLVYDQKTGALLTNRTWNYKPPGVKDIPIDFRVQFRRNAPNPAGVLRSKATGEPPLNMAVGIIFAIRQAITSARADIGLPEDQWYHIDIPLTTENIIKAASNGVESFDL